MNPDLLALWARLCDPNDRVASSEFAEAAFPWLLGQLHGTDPNAPEELLLEAAEETVLSLIRNPAAFDPSRGPLLAYLRRSARCDLKNALAKEKRHARHDLRIFVEPDKIPGNDFGEESERLEDHPELLAIRDKLDPIDQAVWDLLRFGASTEEIAAAMGKSHLPLKEQREAVKCARDRMVLRFKREAKRDQPH